MKTPKCTSCGKVVRKQNKKMLCSPCASRKYYKELGEYRNENNLCMRCGSERDSGFKTCSSCREKNTRAHYKRMVKAGISLTIHCCVRGCYLGERKKI